MELFEKFITNFIFQTDVWSLPNVCVIFCIVSHNGTWPLPFYWSVKLFYLVSFCPVFWLVFHIIKVVTESVFFSDVILALLFQRKSRAIVIARSSSLLLSLLLSCKNFNATHYSKNTKLGMLVDHDNLQLQDKGNNS